MLSWTGFALVLVVVIAAGAVILFLWQPVWLFHHSEFEVGNEIVSKIDAFQASHGYLPETLNEIGIDDPDLKVFYRKVSNDEYWVWFGTTLGESETFNSRTRKWE
jgi:hypothetical protein